MAKGDTTVATFRNHTKLPQIFLDIKVDGVVHDKVRVLQGSNIELPVSEGLKYRKVLTKLEPVETAKEADVTA